MRIRWSGSTPLPRAPSEVHPVVKHRFQASAFALALLVCAAPSWAGKAASHAFPAVVRKVIDGDTLDAEIQVVDAGGRHAPLEIRVRVIGIDTPETNSWDRSKPPELCALAAKRRAEALLPRGSAIQLVSDPHRKRGSYNRELFYVETATGEDFGLTLIREGLAREVNFEKVPYQRRVAYRKAAKQAGRPLCE